MKKEVITIPYRIEALGKHGIKEYLKTMGVVSIIKLRQVSDGTQVIAEMNPCFDEITD